MAQEGCKKGFREKEAVMTKPSTTFIPNFPLESLAQLSEPTANNTPY